MKFFSIVGNSFGCSASGERLVSAARYGDFQDAKALLDYKPRLARYSTFGVRNSPSHYSAAQGHHEIVTLLLESGVDVNLRNHRGQTALMQACQYGHWEVVQILILFKANGLKHTSGLSTTRYVVEMRSVAKECGWRDIDCVSSCQDPCVVCLERRCTVAAEGCGYEFCKHCGSYVCTTHYSTTVC